MAKKKVADLLVDTLAGADESNFRYKDLSSCNYLRSWKIKSSERRSVCIYSV